MNIKLGSSVTKFIELIGKIWGTTINISININKNSNNTTIYKNIILNPDNEKNNKTTIWRNNELKDKNNELYYLNFNRQELSFKTIGKYYTFAFNDKKVSFWVGIELESKEGVENGVFLIINENDNGVGFIEPICGTLRDDNGFHFIRLKDLSFVNMNDDQLKTVFMKQLESFLEDIIQCQQVKPSTI